MVEMTGQACWQCHRSREASEGVDGVPFRISGCCKPTGLLPLIEYLADGILNSGVGLSTICLEVSRGAF
jgi:hypothetical protein